MAHLKQFQSKYEAFCKGNPDEKLNKLFMGKIKSGEYNDLFTDSFFRLHTKDLFKSTLFKVKNNNSWSKELKKICRDLEDTISEHHGNLKEDSIYNLVFDQLFNDWTREISPFMKELDSLVDYKQHDFQKNPNQKLLEVMIKAINESKKPGFSEIEETLKKLKIFQSQIFRSPFELYEQLTLENQKKDMEIKALKEEIEKLKSINPEIREGLLLSDE
jgi:hypothetical protein